MAVARATLMLGVWPEPFALVAIESMATGTLVIALRAGGCTETIEHGITDPRLGRGGPSGNCQERPHERGSRVEPARQAAPTPAQNTSLIPCRPTVPTSAIYLMAAMTAGLVAALRVERLRQHNRVEGRRILDVRLPSLRRP